MVEEELLFVKLGGSLITDKTRPETARRPVIRRLARELRRALDARPGLQVLLGHGSGSFGHWHASQHGTRAGVRGAKAWAGFAQVSASAARLNQLVVDLCLAEGVPVFGVRPSSSAHCRDGLLLTLDARPIHHVLREGLVPLVHGDVAMDEVRGGTIISTEEIMSYLAVQLRPRRVLLLGETPGVLDSVSAGGEEKEREPLTPAGIVPLITPANIHTLASSLAGSHAPDVTGGMMSKVQQMLALVQRMPELTVHVLSGREPGLLTRALLNPDVPRGTRIKAGERAA